MVLDSLKMEAPKTKTITELLKKLDVKKALIVTGDVEMNAYKSVRNMEGVTLVPCNNINVYDIIKYETLILNQDAVKKLEEVYA